MIGRVKMRGIFGAMRCAMLVGVASSCLVGGTAAADFIYGKTLYGYCQIADDPEEKQKGWGYQNWGLCFGYIQGIFDALHAGNLFCTPDLVTPGQLKDVVQLYLNDHPEARSRSARSR
jgi:Ssp1 endopeptidase immunity protein Rap1a